RTTFDVDFLIFSAQMDEVHAVMTRLGYERLHQSADVAQYQSKDPDKGQVDFLLAHRKYATAMLQRAKKQAAFGKQVKVLAPEDLIGLKVQSSANDPQRATKDKADIEDLIKRHTKTLDWKLVEEYFRLFQREDELTELKKRFS